MSDAESTTPAPAADPGNPNRDRGDLSDIPPAQVDGDAVIANTDADEEEAGDDADAART